MSQQDPEEQQEEVPEEEPRTMITQAQINESLSVIARTAGKLFSTPLKLFLCRWQVLCLQHFELRGERNLGVRRILETLRPPSQLEHF